MSRFLCLLAALAVIEAPGILLQLHDWGTMVQDRTPKMGFEAAVADSLSGDHPCPKCLALAKEREEKRERAPVEDHRRADLLISVVITGGSVPALPQTSRALPASAFLVVPPPHPEDVPTPPPQGA